MTEKSAFRWRGLLYCRAHYPGPSIVMDENKVIKRPALLGMACVTCHTPFLIDAPEPEYGGAERRFRELWAEDVRQGRALPSAGDLFD